MQRPESSELRARRFESYEERLALSSQPVAEYAIDQALDPVFEGASSPSSKTSEGHGWTDVAAARDQFGLRGDHQTVAIIDSGIAYDHVALGGGLGKAYRVVGGWDFAENDATPYDDGPAGFHGTHVAGIVGADDKRYSGVAPDVDLVALRVFDDQGHSNFTWVEQALAWVHQHRNDYANPITTVNLSLGAEWNSNSLPSWATLENEFKQLADDGIFISVAAGNSFQTYNAPGLSYPAASPYVTPVASVDANGNLSRFSQRNDRVLAAPGERIMSTLPDYFYGGDGVKNDWGAASGTSMAAPYVAGASVLAREAMQELGYTQITQDTIYDLFRRTADSVYDAVTSANYSRLNLQRALDTLVGPDDYGSTEAAATSLGRLSTTIQVSGTIGRTSDQDFFQFVADKSGKVTLSLSGTQQLGARWQEMGGGHLDGGKLVLDVVAGQSYTLGLAGGGAAIGKYTVAMQLDAQSAGGPTNAINWGTIDQLLKDNVAVSGGDQWFQLSAGQSGRLTVEAFFNQGQGNIDLDIFDAQQRLLGSSHGGSGRERIDLNAALGDKLFLRVHGSNSDVDFRLTNLLSIAGNSATIAGTAKDDSFSWQAGSQQQIVVNGVSYVLAGVTEVKFDGRGGSDQIVLTGGSAAETATLRVGSVELTGSGYHAIATGVERSQVNGGAGDRAWLYDSAGNDVLDASPTAAMIRGTGFSNQVCGFEQVDVVAAAGGFDNATLRDSRGTDQFDASSAFSWLRGSGYSIRAAGFDNVTVLATAGSGDIAHLLGSTTNDVLTVFAGTRSLSGGGVQIFTQGFQRVDFDGGGGSDTIDLYTSASTSSLSGRQKGATLTDAAFITDFTNIESVLANVRAAQTLQTELAALDFVFKRIGRS